MIEFLKSWQSQINSFKFSTYQLTLMCIWYFQYTGHIPSVKFLQSGVSRIYCGGNINIGKKSDSKYFQVTFPFQMVWLTSVIQWQHWNQSKNPVCCIIWKIFSIYLENSSISILILYHHITENYLKLIWKIIKMQIQIILSKWHFNDFTHAIFLNYFLKYLTNRCLKFLQNSNHSNWTKPHVHMFMHDIFKQSISFNVTANLKKDEIEMFQKSCKLTSEINWTR